VRSVYCALAYVETNERNAVSRISLTPGTVLIATTFGPVGPDGGTVSWRRCPGARIR
jgi:hypothetical protein